MQQIRDQLAELGVNPAPEPVKINRRDRPAFDKVAGESKASRRLRRRAAFVR